jgi:beta-glucosidase
MTRHRLDTECRKSTDEPRHIIGDLITQRWESDGKEVWAQYYARRDALNLGLSGDMTQHVLWRLDNGNLDGLEPKVIVLMIGTNNITGEATSVPQVADAVAAIVKKLRERLPRARRSPARLSPWSRERARVSNARGELCAG